MKRETLQALRESIQKWKSISSGRGYDQGRDNCALCKRFGYFCADYTSDCDDEEKCPVYRYTGETDCAATPYDDFVIWATEGRPGRIATNKEARKYALKMYELLRKIESSYAKKFQRMRSHENTA